MVKLFGLTTVAALTVAQNEAKKWKADFFENNETIERLQQMLNAIQKENLELKTAIEKRDAKIETLTQELADCRTWVKTLEDTNKVQVEKLRKQVETINNALNESAQTGLILKQATVEIASLKLANSRYKIAADNFLLEVTKN